MAYQKNKPQPTDKLKSSQGDLLGNFQSLYDLLAVNHDVSVFNSPASGVEGKHKAVTFVEQTGDPSVGATEVALYTKDFGGDPHIYFKNAGMNFDLSNVAIGSAGNVSTLSFNLIQQYDAAHQLIFKTGSTTAAQVANNTTTLISYPAPFPNETVHVVVTPFLSSVDTTIVPVVTVKSFNASGFTVFLKNLGSSSPAINLMFFAIGR